MLQFIVDLCDTLRGEWVEPPHYNSEGCHGGGDETHQPAEGQQGTVGLYHTSGLSTPSQVFMALMSLTH